ncbi:serine hydrolase-like protein 2 isoform X1 [Gallus gallus]|uniref:Serine hydrolase-like (pseudo n=2 Tax=Phasianidae TaxID=9005 RepID=F1NJK4_CHICK|nr:serine hydrolase-like protein 2 [Gallus gallus]XP_025004232.1 serine hydrolase-like protein 2 isoform X1 [Gallus gallus]XP_040552369.1 serine hydrolase-like protein 2 isoform X1 [Gallus gallus]XP_040552371.1 serine hydrolase-like protein 2 isoform X1 [Gallus gallus]XP_046763379.1 serine hydrolase-like protein 2 isoform X1 [Gallus gallus]XP_046763380.1 serine hydrolase-like protein 2 isoform X1 [Gallus gallus]XP_046763381.1 serine hydrolase-like protein 2 isoform X1 [Gallus gallus]POI35939|eukprot:NP_001264302.1 serine hydrolase-like protein 2 [Gallus gallus]
MFSEVKFPVPWGHVAAKAWGPPEGHPVLCLHGWLDNANTFDRLIPLLPRDCRYVAMDFSGHGLSSHRPAGSPYHFLDYVSDVRRVAAALRWRRFTLMGHSMGGSVAGMFAFIYPEMVDKLILLENLGFLLAPEDTEAWLKSKRLAIDRLLSLEAKQQAPKARSPEAALQRLLEANRHLTAEGGAILLQRGATETPTGLVYNRDMRVRTQSREYLTVEQCVKLLQKIKDRVLIILAQDGLLVPHKLESRNQFVKSLREAFEHTLKEDIQLVEVPGSHFVHLNEPEVVSGIISNFLTAQNTRARL